MIPNGTTVPVPPSWQLAHRCPMGTMVFQMRSLPVTIRRSRGPWACHATCLLVVLLQVGTIDAGQPAAGGRTIVDHAVVQAGGGCRSCGQPHCRGCQGGHHRHHAGCRGGHCHPHCPVRPQEFGFYETNWRRWPSSGVVPVTNLEGVTPATPPKSEVPTADEESATLPRDESPIPEEGASFRSRPSVTPNAPPPQPPAAAEPIPPPRQPGKQALPPAATTQPPAAPQPSAPKPQPSAPKPQPSAPKPQPPAKPGPAVEKDPFDESRARSPLRRLAVDGRPPRGQPIQSPRPVAPRQPAAEAASFQAPQAPEPPPLIISRVPFDAEAEAGRLHRNNTPRR